MKYVIDTSVDIKRYVQEQDSGKAVRLRNEYHQGVHQLIAPDIFPTQMCTVLMILERSGKIKSGEADLFFRHCLSVLPPLFAAVPLLPRAPPLGLSPRHIGPADLLCVGQDAGLNWSYVRFVRA